MFYLFFIINEEAIIDDARQYAKSTCSALDIPKERISGIAVIKRLESEKTSDALTLSE